MRLLLINTAMDEANSLHADQADVAYRLAQKIEHLTVLTENIGSYPKTPNMNVYPRRRSKLLANFQLWRLIKREKCDVILVESQHNWAFRFLPMLHTGQSAAINTDLFMPPELKEDVPALVYVGRMTQHKRIALMIDTLAYLRALAPEIPWQLQIFGPSVTRADHIYMYGLTEKVMLLGLTNVVKFTGAIKHTDIPAVYKTAALHLDFSHGNINKAALEALACGCPILTTNPALREVLAPQPDMFAQADEAMALAAHIRALYARRHEILPAQLRSLVMKYDMNSHVEKLLAQLNGLSVRPSQAADKAPDKH